MDEPVRLTLTSITTRAASTPVPPGTGSNRAASAAPPSVFNRLVEFGVAPAQAQEWAETLPCYKLLAWIDMGIRQAARHPEEWLRAAITRNYPIPASIAEQAAESRTSVVNQALVRATERQLEAERATEHAARHAAEDRYQRLPEPVQVDLTNRVMIEANALHRRLMAGPAGRGMLVARCLAILDAEPKARLPGDGHHQRSG